MDVQTERGPVNVMSRAILNIEPVYIPQSIKGYKQLQEGVSTLRPHVLSRVGR